MSDPTPIEHFEQLLDALKQNTALDVTSITVTMTPHKTTVTPRRKASATNTLHTDEAWFSRLCKADIYQHIDVGRELEKCIMWCNTRNLKPTKQRFVNWLNRIEVGLAGRGTGSATTTWTPPDRP